MKPATLLPFLICLAFLLAPILGRTQSLWAPPKHEWVDLDSMNQFRAYFPAVATANGKIYVFGGLTGPSQAINQIEEYDIASDTWTVLPYTLPQPLCEMAAVELGEAIYIIGGAKEYGGAPTSKVYRFYPDTGFDSTNIASLTSPRAFMSACVADGKIFVIGGIDYSGAVLNTVEVYDTLTKQWTPSGHNLISKRAAHTSVVVGNKIYVMGGTQSFSTGLNSVEVFDLDNPAAGWGPAQSLLHGRMGHGSAVLVVDLVDTVIVSLGGIASLSSTEMSVEGLAPAIAGDTSEYICDLQYDRRAFGCVSFENNIYIMGGNSGAPPGATVLSTTNRLDLIVATREFTPSSLETPVALLPNIPNPFGQGTELSFMVRKPADIMISVFDAAGHRISTPVSGRYGAGEYHIPFDGAGLEAGIYFCILNSDNLAPIAQKWVVMRK